MFSARLKGRAAAFRHGRMRLTITIPPYTWDNRTILGVGGDDEEIERGVHLRGERYDVDQENHRDYRVPRERYVHNGGLIWSKVAFAEWYSNVDPRWTDSRSPYAAYKVQQLRRCSK